MSEQNQSTVTPASERETLKRLRADLRTAAATLGPAEVRYLVDLYYQVQDFRLRAQSQQRANSIAVCATCESHVSFKKNKKTGERFIALHDVDDPDCERGKKECDGSGDPAEKIIHEPNELVTWAFEEFESVEKTIKGAMDVWSDGDPVAAWAKSLHGIGEVIAAGISAQADAESTRKTPTVGHLWSFAGLNPEQVWEKGCKRPFNPKLKLLAWKAGDSFMKQRAGERKEGYPEDGSRYGEIFEKRWEVEKRRNEEGLFADQAKASLAEKNYDKKTEAYKAYVKDRLPAGRILLRAQRVASKIFLSHWLVVAKWLREGILIPQPYALTHLCGCGHRGTDHDGACKICKCRAFANGHVHVHPIPNVRLVPGLGDALRAAGRTA